MLGYYTNFNNMYTNQSYQYGQSVMNSYQQKSSFFGGYSSTYQQQPAYNNKFTMFSMFNSLRSLMHSSFGNKQATQQAPINTQQPVATTIPFTNANSGQNTIFSTIINIVLNQWETKAPAETIEVPPEKPEDVVLIGSYKNNFINNYSGSVNVDLGNTIKDFASMEGGNPSNAGGDWSSNVHNKDSANDETLKELFSKMSEEDKKKNFNNGEVYIISKCTGEILGTAANKQIYAFTDNKVGYNSTAEQNNDNFKVISDLGVDQTSNWSQIKNNEEGLGGQIELNGKTYNVDTTVLRKETPLTFDLNGDGVKTSDKVIQYDIDGNGTLDTINDVADGTLSIRGGKDGKDLFGNNTDLDADGKADGFANGFEALKSLALKERLINNKDDMKLDTADLQKLKDKYDLGIKTEGYNSEAKSLESMGITEINLGITDEVQEKVNFDGRNNDILTQTGATFRLNGEEREYADVLHTTKA